MASREPSAAPSSGGDTIEDHEEVKPSIVELDRDDSAADLPVVGTPSSVRTTKKSKGSTAKKPRPKKGSLIFMHDGPGDGTEDDTGKSIKAGSPAVEGDRTQGTAVGTRRQANGTVGSVYSGSKVRHIKKPDGTPLWRKEIQYEFLRLVIEDTTPVFTRISDGKKNCNFADIYIDCMARSSKTSKILKDRLQVDRQAAQNMAMICLLVNVGRMNTTLNFFPEMRAQLRTYHSIPSLQAYKSQKDYKSLQDAPRLKSILKGASEDTDEPRTLVAVKDAKVPRTNPVNLIFILSQNAPDVALRHFVDKVDFFDLAIRSTITSKSRARAFLWLMWWYLESETHDRESALNNPFGPGEFKEDQDPNDPNEVPQLVPALVNITEEEGDLENVDPEEEKVFAEKMTRERKRIMLEDRNTDTPAQPSEFEHKGVKRLKKNAREFDDDSDADSARASPGYGRSPAGEGMMGMMSSRIGASAQGDHADSNEDDWEAVDPHPGRGRYKRVKGKNTPSRSKNRVSEGPIRPRGARASGLGYDRGTPDTVGARGTPQPLPPGSGNHVILSQYDGQRSRRDGDGAAPTKSRARTGYQRQLEEHKQSRIEWLLRKKRKESLKEAKLRREGGRWLQDIMMRVQDLDATYDSEEDEDLTGTFFGSALNAPISNGIGIGGLIARRVAISPKDENNDDEATSLSHGLEEDDYGEEAETWLKVFKRTKRRLETWSGERDHEIYLAKKSGILPTSNGTSNSNGNGNPTTTTGANSKSTRRNRNNAPLSSSSTTKNSRSNNNNSNRRSGLSSSSNRKSDGMIIDRPRRSGEMSLNDEITQDLLAERSDEDDDVDIDGDGDDDVDADGDGDGDGDVDMTLMDDTLGPDADGEGEGEGDDSDVEMD